MSGCSGALKPDKLGSSCKANKCSDAGTGDLGVLHSHETSPCLGDAAAGSSSKCAFQQPAFNYLHRGIYPLSSVISRIQLGYLVRMFVPFHHRVTAD